VELREVEELIGELETRVDRVRALYDQYFMGFEKLEPLVPRKDVDRRIHDLRKEQIRNTGLRFRFHMIIQRYNTYQTFWARICRQIEDGTFKRHMMRAETRFGVDLRRGRKVKEFEEDIDLDELDDAIATIPPPSLKSPAAQAPALAIPAAPRAPALPGDRYDDVRLDPDFVVPVDAIELDYQELGPPAPPPRVSSPRSEPGTGTGPGAGAGAGANKVWRKVGTPSAAAPARSAAPLLPGGGPPVVSRPPTPAASSPSAPGAPRATSVARPPVQVQHPAPGPVPSRRPDAELPDERVRQLYTQYVETKRRRNESTAAITYDGLAKSLRESSAKLRAQHGKSVDFEVTVKDGKTVIRPVVKS
jgi:hypothetical protein